MHASGEEKSLRVGPPRERSTWRSITSSRRVQARGFARGLRVLAMEGGKRAEFVEGGA